MEKTRQQHAWNRMFSFALALLMTVSAVMGTALPSKAAELPEYEIYPHPQTIEYGDASYIIQKEINIVYEKTVDKETKARLEETLALKGSINSSVSEQLDKNKTNILVGIYGSNGYVDQYVKNHSKINTTNLFEKTDAYLLSNQDGVITILGKDSDACFYGLTTFYHILKQLDSYTIRNFHIEDWADVVSRGFIEGYYGNPWSTNDRINLMKWAGYYKLNSYIYAPKNDPKHNEQWRQMYSEDELKKMIIPLSEAGQKSKCRFVYALHPFMHNPIKFGSDEQYAKDLQIVKDKFTQVIEKGGVRQIAILADDANNVGGKNYVRFLKDMVNWLETMKEKYPDLKMNLPFCTQEYMYGGQDYYRDFPQNVQIVMTGGKIWGEVSDGFTNSFAKKTGRGPYLWINWPCSDNSKKHLIMGGYDTFLHPNVNPENIQGIVLNPMQQSEPSKVAIFGNACYAWNIWKDKATANKAWEDSFKYVDHNSAIENEASAALRELSKHMINQNMDDRVTKLQESVELAEKINTFKDKLNNGTLQTEDISKMLQEFETLQNAAEVYRAQAGDENLRDQIKYWLDCWKDTNTAAIAYLNGIKAVLEEDTTSVYQYSNEAKTAWNASKNHPFLYVNHNEYAEVGVQHIVPFINAMDTYLSKKVQEISDPTIITSTYISNAFTRPSSGSTEAIFDGKDQTSVQFKEPNYPKANDYFGVKYNRAIDVKTIRVVMGEGKNHLQYSKLQYLPKDADEKNGWKDVNNKTYTFGNGSSAVIEEQDLNLKDVAALRLVATKANEFDSWVSIASFDVNKKENKQEQYDVSSVSIENANAVQNTDTAKVTDNNEKTELWLKGTGDFIPADAAVMLDLGKDQEIGAVSVVQDVNRANGTDILDKAVVEVKQDGSAEWKEFAALKKANKQTVAGIATARYVRVRNLEKKDVWWRLGEITVYPTNKNAPLTLSAKAVNTQIGKNGAVNDNSKNNKYDYIVDGNESTLAWLAGNGNTDIYANQGVQIDFNKETALKEIAILQGSGDRVSSLKIEYAEAGQWKELTTVKDAGTRVKVDGKGTMTNAIRLLNTEADTNHWWQLYEVKIKEQAQRDAQNVFSNVQKHNFDAAIEEEQADLSTGNITLKPNEYIGIDLKEIKKIASVEKDVTKDGIVLEWSNNGKIWENDKTINGKTARYVRLRNSSQVSVDTNVKKFIVHLESIGEIGELISSDISIIKDWGDSRNNGKAFDNDINTQTKFGGTPKKGNTIVYSFGREIDVRSLRIYTSDGTTDYIRDAKVQLSMDGLKWDDAFEIGDGVKDTSEQANKNMVSSGAGNVDTNYPNIRYYGKDDINRKAKFMRLLITADYPNRALIINEVMINGGEYISPESNMAFMGTMEERGHIPSKMLDGNFTSTYLPSAKNGSMTYQISDGSAVRSIRIIQNGNPSNALVKATAYNEKTGKEEVMTLGHLTQALNEFKIGDGLVLLNIEISWGEQLPEIAEILLLEKEASLAEKSALNELLMARPAEYEQWTSASKQKYDGLVKVAEVLKEDAAVSQLTVDNMMESLKKASAQAKMKAAPADIESLMEAVKNQLPQDVYTTNTYASYANCLKKIELALKDKENLSREEAKQLLEKIKQAKSSLAYSIRNRELAELELYSFALLEPNNYTVESYQKLAEAKKLTEEKIAADKDAASSQDRIDPATFLQLRESYKKDMEDLVDITALRTEVETKVDDSLYTPDSVAAYAAALEESKPLFQNGTKEEIAKAIAQLQEKREQLVLLTDIQLHDLLQKAQALEKEKYTSESYGSLMHIVDEAKKPGINQEEYIAKLDTAMKALVNVEALKTKADETRKLDPKQYTVASYQTVEDLLKEADMLLRSGQPQEILEWIDSINASIQKLELRSQDLEKYRADIVWKEQGNYTESSYQLYKDAYFALMQADPANTSVKLFEQLKSDFENAELALTINDQSRTVNKQKLYEQLKLFDGYQSKDYTDQSWAVFKKAYDHASNVYMDVNAAQTEVDLATLALEKAGNALQNRETGQQADHQQEQTKLPMVNTAAATLPVGAAAGVFLFSLLGVVALNKRKQHHK